MAFDQLSTKLQDVFKQLKGKGKLSDKDVKLALREVKLALLEADVNFKVVKQFIKTIEERAVGHEVMESLTPGQQVIKIVNEELINLMGSTQSKINFAPRGITVIMMVGLQGAGKTTTSAKLSSHIKSQGKRPLLVACDVYRPAAIDQLTKVGKQVNVPVFSMGSDKNPVDIAQAGVNYAKENNLDVVIIDTAGRLHIDEVLMDELKNIKALVKPQEILLVVDAMTGQDAVNVAESFDQTLGLDGVVMTKLDGDSRGGAALSVKAVTNKPIKFVGMGEKLNDLEPFHPERIASRILGMGDVLTLIEKAQQNIDEKKAKELEAKFRKAEFNFEDFLEQMQQIKNMGPISQLLGMIPGMNAAKLNEIQGQVDEKQMAHIEAIILSMTKAERLNPSLLNMSRKKRIAQGSGRDLQEVNRLIKQFEQMQGMMKQFSGAMKGKKGKFKFPFM
ncbi:signal recognition particle protein [Cellulosilyticum sp. ST5]|uniref:Signal recognition particle protein n=1 Tax=Cellulosilyticum lentocellum (strain ATCC 49066 / DSM 5427 / NCIMB 11756 / RHM5) TaxID=642492 RepID=F2JS77_CELLD|nr:MULTISPECIES: signal recognition particle protein [Cellulosilyticum]ADZ84014.1 signal recognition particle protein [Cellulosilyticum lentocellum DSM 5427]QEH69480.1 signal recognition particle protein [Cellulosilyticum sp. WCF-2]